MRLLLESGAGVETGAVQIPGGKSAPGPVTVVPQEPCAWPREADRQPSGWRKHGGGWERWGKRAARRLDGTGACDHLHVFGFHTE